MGNDEIFLYYQSHVKPLTTDTPIGQADVDGTPYFYFTKKGTLVEDDYWHHLADLPIPASFKLFDYSFDGSSITHEQHLILTQNYQPGVSPFLLNVRERDYLRETYLFDEKNGKFVEFEISSLDVIQYGWDHKRLSETAPISMLACGTKCRETIVLGREQYQLLVFYSEEAMTGDKSYYIPCLGKTNCATKGTADVVYFNCNRQYLIDDWLKHLVGIPYKRRPGIADHIQTPRYKTFGTGSESVTIQYTDDSGELYLRLSCRPLHVRC